MTFPKELTTAINRLAAGLTLLHELKQDELEWLKSRDGLATRQDVCEAKEEILKALGERIDAKQARKLAKKLAGPTEALARAVEDNQPTISGQ